MKKPYEYYIEKIKQTYPELKTLMGNYARIETNINAEIAAGGTGKNAVKELYNYTLIQFKQLAKFYADNGLDHKTFEDAMSGLYVTLIENFNKRLDRGRWFKNLNSFNTTIEYDTNAYLNKVLQNHSNKYYLTDKILYGQQRSLISRIKTSDSDKEYTLVQIDKEKDLDWLEELEDVVATAQPDEIIAQKDLQSKFVDIFKTLQPKEVKVVNLIFGLDDGRPKTLGEVGAALNYSKERVRQILAKALRKLRHPSRTKTIHEFY